MHERIFYMFRHGETAWNVQKRIQGSTPHVPLNERGFHQARKIADMLKDKGIGCVYSSPLLRTHQTASVVAATCKVPVVLVDHLRERSFGKLEGLTFEDVDRDYPEIGALLRTQKDWDFKEAGMVCGVETIAATQARIYAAMHALAQHEVAEPIAVSTHGGALYNFLHQIEAVPLLSQIGNGEVFTIGHSTKGFRFIARS